MKLHYTFFKVTAEFYLESSDEWDTDGYDVEYEYEVDDKEIYKAVAKEAADRLPGEVSKEKREAYAEGYAAALEDYNMIDCIDEDDVKELFREEAEDAFKEEQ